MVRRAGSGAPLGGVIVCRTRETERLQIDLSSSGKGINDL